MSRFAIAGALCMAAVIIIYYVYFSTGDNGNTRKIPHAPVIAATAVIKDVPVWLDALGTVQGDTTITVKTQVTGQIIDEPYTEGQFVKKGDVLARIDPRPYQATLDQAMANKAKDQAMLDDAKLDLKRYIALGDAVTGQTLDTQRATVKELENTVKADQAAIESAVTQLSYTMIRAPVGGLVGLQQVDPGNIAQISDTNGIALLTVIEPADVMFSLPQQDISEIQEAMAAQKAPLQVLAVDSDNQTILDHGTLAALDNQVNASTGAVLLKSVFPNAAHKLWPGAFVNVRLLLKTVAGSLTVPTVAVQQGPKGDFVFLLDPVKDTVSMHPITIGGNDDLDTIVTSGLNAGDQVIVEGMAKLEDGMSVTVADPNADPSAEPGKDSNPSDTSGAKKHQRKKTAPQEGQGTGP